MVLIATIAGLSCLLRKTASEEHVEELLCRELGLEATGIGIFVISESTIVIEAVCSSYILLILAIQVV
jgi:hypothetical protein